MYAIVEVGGKQFKVAEKDTILVPTLDAKEGKSIDLKPVLLFSKDGTVTIGSPHVAKVKVKAKVEGEAKGKKLIVFKMKRRTGYHRKRGHRQKYTKLTIEKITG